jgi:O-methyltransferase involved in polyketide biosynthesis
MTERYVLTEEKETLFVPLLGKATMSRRPHPILVDRKAEEIIDRIDYDFERLLAPKKTLTMLAMRAKQLDSYVREYLRHAEDPLVLHLGCGLDSRVLRVEFDRGLWYDVDYPDVIALRRQFYEETPGYHMIGSSVTDQAWLDQLPRDRGSACIIAEGLLMYLTDEQVRTLFAELQTRLPGSEISFDAFSTFAAKAANRHPSIKKTGAHISWGIDDPSQMEQWGTGMKLLDEWCFSDSEDIASLGLGDRLMFGATGLFGFARRAQRILRFRM